MKRWIAVFLAAALMLGGCAREEKAAQRTIWAMDTYMDLKIWGGDGEAAAEQIAGLLEELEDDWSATWQPSLLARLNRGELTSLPREKQAVLDRAEALSARTGGAFCPKLGAVSRAWGFYGQQYRVPAPAEVEAALAQEQWDLGAVLKGYAGDRAVEILSGLDVDRAVLNLGGNVQTFGEKPDGSPWNIAIRDPESWGTSAAVQVRGTASVVTSGSYQRCFEENGVRYHHILDPETGYPADSGLEAVTVICRDGMTADALSTALFVMGLEKAAEFWRQSDDFEAVFFLTDGRVVATEGAALYGCEFEVISR